MRSFKNTLRTLAAGAIICRLAALGPPASPQGIGKREIAAVRFTTPPVIDGDLSDPCWQTAPKADRFTDLFNGGLVQDQTIAMVGYDDQKIYVAFHCFDSQPRSIVARQTKRGTPFQGEDYVDFALDLFHTHQFADRSTFSVNPLGTEYAVLAGGRAAKLEWEGKWQAAARIVADGWTAEMAIPWAILNHPAVKGPTVCGINFGRSQDRTKIYSIWSNLGPQLFLEQDGLWNGIEFPSYHSRLSLLPYVSAGWQAQGGKSLRSGLDLRDALTPSLTAVGTINPDFANVEEAVEGIDFSYGERFVPDRRPFFQEGASVYGIGGVAGSYFYSRRIDAFDTGINLYGKLNPRDSLGVLAALNLGHRADWFLRGRHDFGPDTDVNIGFLNRDDTRLSNRVLEVGEDFRQRFWSLNAHWAGSWLNGRHTGGTANATFSYQSPRWSAQVLPFSVSPDFRDDLGFIPFTDFRGVLSSVSYATQWRHGSLRSLSAGLNSNDSQHYDGRLFRQERSGFLNLQTRRDYSLSLGWDGGRFEQFNDSVFSLNLGARVSDPFHNYGLGYSWGRRAAHSYTFITPHATWRFARKLTLGLSSSLLFHTQNEQQHIVTFNYDFSPQQGIGGRVVAQTGGTNGYFSYRHSGYGGTEMFLILGDPNAQKFQKRVVLKVVWAL